MPKYVILVLWNRRVKCNQKNNSAVFEIRILYTLVATWIPSLMGANTVLTSQSGIADSNRWLAMAYAGQQNIKPHRMLATITVDDNPRSSRVSIWQLLINCLSLVYLYGEIAETRLPGKNVVRVRKTVADPRRKSRGRTHHHASISSYIHFNAQYNVLDCRT